jgi:nucleotide-binding universal stress UspA family protein
MFDRILFATTASPTCDAAAHVAFDLAKKYNAALTVFHVFGFPTRGFSTFAVDVRTGDQEEVDAEYHDWVKEEMRNTYEQFLDNKHPIHLETRVGVPSTEILREARKLDADLIVMGAHTREEDVGATRYRGVVGSTMQKVARKARCPVLIISRPCLTCYWYFSNIVFATDFSKAADHAFQFAHMQAKEIGCRLHIFHAVDLSHSQIGVENSQAMIEQAVTDARKQMEQRYIRQFKEFDNYSAEVWEGIPYVEILKFAREKSADLIIMAHHTREVDPEEAQLGSTVEQVVLRSACPVASVNHPDKVADVP